MPKRAPTLFEVLAGNVGVVNAGRVLAFMVQWETVRRDSDGFEDLDVTGQIRAYASWWRESERTAWRELRRFRDVLPGQDTPSAVMDAAGSAWDARKGAASLGVAPLPALG